MLAGPPPTHELELVGLGFKDFFFYIKEWGGGGGGGGGRGERIPAPELP